MRIEDLKKKLAERIKKLKYISLFEAIAGKQIEGIIRAAQNILEARIKRQALDLTNLNQAIDDFILEVERNFPETTYSYYTSLIDAQQMKDDIEKIINAICNKSLSI